MAECDPSTSSSSITRRRVGDRLTGFRSAFSFAGGGVGAAVARKEQLVWGAGWAAAARSSFGGYERLRAAAKNLNSKIIFLLPDSARWRNE